MTYIEDSGYSHNRKQRISAYNDVLEDAENISLDSALNDNLNLQLENVNQVIPEDSLSGSKMSYLEVEKLVSGTIYSQQITLAALDGEGDTYIAAGKTDFTITESGFILGIDDSDSNTPKFYLGNSSDYLYWDGTSLVVAGGIVVLVSLTAGQDLTAGKCARIYTDGKAYYASAISSVFTPYLIGVVSSTVSSGQTATIQISQEYTTSGLSAGVDYLLTDGTDDITQTTSNTTVNIYSTAVRRSQTFTPTVGRLDAIWLRGARTGTGCGDITIDIYATAAGLKTGAILFSTVAVATGALSTSPTLQVFYFNTPATLTSGTMYAMDIVSTGGTAANTWDIDISTANPYAGGTMLNDNAISAGNDIYFRNVYFTGSISSTAGTVSKEVGLAIAATKLILRIN